MRLCRCSRAPFEVPPGVVTVTDTMPVPAGAVAVIWVEAGDEDESGWGCSEVDGGELP